MESFDVNMNDCVLKEKCDCIFVEVNDADIRIKIILTTMLGMTLL